MEVYIDEINVKSKTHAKQIQNLEEVFVVMRKYDMKLNPLKCVFGVSVGKFLGFLVTQQGIKTNLDQVKVMLETPILSIKKETQ